MRPTVLRGTFHVYELAALVSAARYVTRSAPPGIPAASLEQLQHLLDDYDQQVRELSAPDQPDQPDPPTEPPDSRPDQPASPT